MTGEALTTQGSLTRGFRPDVVWAVLKRRNAEAPQGIEELGARQAGDVRRALLRKNLQLVPFHRRRQTEFAGKILWFLVQGCQGFLRYLDRRVDMASGSLP